jgi:hypothetical protein
VLKIIFELIRSEIKKITEGQPEKIFIALRAIVRIYELSQEQSSNPPENNEVKNLSLDEFMPSICDFTKQIILALDRIFRDWLLSIQTKTINGYTQFLITSLFYI